MDKEAQKYFDGEDKARIMEMKPEDMNISEFLVFKGILQCTDLDRPFNLMATRDAWIGTVRKITEAMNEWADIKSKDAVFYFRCSTMQNP